MMAGRRELLGAGVAGVLSLASAQARPLPSIKGAGGRRLPAIIDVHAHPPMPSFLKAVRSANPEGAADVGAGRVLADWTPELGLELMEAHGIEAMVMSNPLGFAGLGPKNRSDLARRVNDEMAEVIARYPRRYGAFAMLPLGDTDASLAEMARALDELGFDGICLTTNIDGVYPGDRSFWPLFEELDRRRGVAFVHPAPPAYLGHLALDFDPSLMEFMIDSCRAAASVIFSGLRRACPNFTYIATHGGGTIPYLVNRFATGQLANAAYGVPLTPDEIRAGFVSLHYELTAATSAGTLASLFELTDSSRMMLGFDYPIRPTKLIAPSIAELAESRFLDDAGIAAIARGNALRLLPRLAARLKH